MLINHHLEKVACAAGKQACKSNFKQQQQPLRETIKKLFTINDIEYLNKLSFIRSLNKFY